MIKFDGLVPKAATNVGPGRNKKIQLLSTPLLKLHEFVMNYRSNCLEIFCEKGVLKNFAKFTEKHLCQNLFFNKVVCLNFAKFLRTPFFIEHLWCESDR